MDRFIYIRNAEDDAYMNTSANFKGMEQASSGVVIMYFESAISSSVGASAYDKITLAVTANSEKQAMVDIAGALAGGKSGTTAVIADDYGSAYCSDLITASAGVTTIAKATGGVTRTVKTITGDTTLLSGESGALVRLNATTGVITLPSASAGLTFDVTFMQDPEAGCTILANTGDCFYGNIKVMSATEDQTLAQTLDYDTAVGTVTSYDNLDFVHDTNSLGGVEGDVIRLYCVDATAWLVDATVLNDHANPATIAIINAG